MYVIEMFSNTAVIRVVKLTEIDLKLLSLKVYGERNTVFHVITAPARNPLRNQEIIKVLSYLDDLVIEQIRC